MSRDRFLQMAEDHVIGLRPQEMPFIIDPKVRKSALWATLLVCWILSLTSLQQYGRVSPLSIAEADWITMLKAIGRLIAILTLGFILLRSRGLRQTTSVGRTLLPMTIFAFWAMASALWSPLKINSLWHAGEFFMFVLFAEVSGIYFSDVRSCSLFFKNLSLIILLYCIVSLLFFYTFRHGEAIYDVGRPFGLVPANLAAEIGGLGFLVLFLFHSVWRSKWSRLLFIPGLAIEGWLVIVMRSRVTLFSTLGALICVLFLAKRRHSLAWMVVFVSILGTILLCFGWSDGIISIAKTYVMRSQTLDEVLTGTGRVDIWRKYLAFFWECPLIGNGHFTLVPMPAGDSGEMVGAHNIFLAVLSGTGLIGGLLFSWGIYRPLHLAWRQLGCDDPQDRKVAILALVLTVWFFLTGQTETALLGPASPVAITFYAILGIAGGRLR